MINRLRRRLITVAMLSLLLVFSVIVSTINVLNYRKMTAEADEVLTMLAKTAAPSRSGNPKSCRHCWQNPRRRCLPAAIFPW